MVARIKAVAPNRCESRGGGMAVALGFQDATAEGTGSERFLSIEEKLLSIEELSLSIEGIFVPMELMASKSVGAAAEKGGSGDIFTSSTLNGSCTVGCCRGEASSARLNAPWSGDSGTNGPTGSSSSSSCRSSAIKGS